MDARPIWSLSLGLAVAHAVELSDPAPRAATSANQNIVITDLCTNRNGYEMVCMEVEAVIYHRIHRRKRMSLLVKKRMVKTHSAHSNGRWPGNLC